MSDTLDHPAASWSRLQVIIGATRPGRLGPLIARWFADIAVRHGGFDVEVVDLADVGLPLLDEPINPAMAEQHHHEHSRVWSSTVRRGDCFVFVVPEYNNSFNAATKNAIDYPYHEWRDKPVGLVSYGGNVGAGTRAVQALKPVLLAVRAMPAHESVNIPFVHSMVGADGFAGSPPLEHAAASMLDELVRRNEGARVVRMTAGADTSQPTRTESTTRPMTASVASGSATS